MKDSIEVLLTLFKKCSWCGGQWDPETFGPLQFHFLFHLKTTVAMATSKQQCHLWQAGHPQLGLCGRRRSLSWFSVGRGAVSKQLG